VAGNLQELRIEAGVAYYLAVFAEDTAGAMQSYYVEAIENFQTHRKPSAKRFGSIQERRT